MSKSFKAILNTILFIVFSSFLIIQADVDGYEGDDLNSIVPAMHLSEMRAGIIVGYKYDWQPLSYQLLHTVYALTESPKYMFMVAPITIALSVLVFFLIVNRKYQIGVLMFSCLLLMFPEIIYTGLYYNSHAPAMLAYLLAILVLFDEKQSVNLQNQSIAIGLLIGLSILFRFDFILGLPIIVILLYFRTSTFKYAIITSISAIVILLLALLMDIFSLENLIEIYQTSSQEIREKSNIGGWNRYTKTMALTTILSPIGWLFFLFGSTFLIKRIKNLKSTSLVFYFLALVPLLYPLKDLLSAKYSLPLLIWLFFMSNYIVHHVSQSLSRRKFQLFNSTFAVVSFLMLFLYIDIDKDSPYMIVSYDKPARSIGTHDGERMWGGYMHQFLKLATTNHNAKNYLEAKKFVDYIHNKRGSTYLFVGEQSFFESGAFGWRYVQLFLANHRTAKSVVVKQDHVAIDIGHNSVHFCKHASCLNEANLKNQHLEVMSR